jgi:2-polyprenyl-3-methyl-5-hydroxy-6-metoxy-1,4-benzoquinol methylase
MAFFRDIFVEKVQRCNKCDFVFTNPRMPADKLALYYTRNYHLEGLPVPKSAEEFLGNAYREIWLAKQRDLDLILSVKTTGRILDVGCASGTLLWLAKQRGFDVRGVEVSQGAAEFVRNVLGMDVVCGQFADGHFRNGEFDVVTMIHVLEHVPNPRQVIRDIFRVLKEDGVLLVVVPNFAGWSSERAKHRWKWLQPENHYSHFTPRTIARLVESEGFVPKITSEEGRYGEEEVRALYQLEEIRKIASELRGSEIIVNARKKNSRELERSGQS